MTTKRQFAGAPQKRTFYDRKVMHYGYSRMIALGKVIPKGWEYVRIAILEKSADHVEIRITKLYGAENNGARHNNNEQKKNK